MKKLFLLAALGALSLSVSGYVTIPLTKKSVNSNQQTKRIPGSLRSPEEIALKTGEKLEAPKQEDSISLEIAGVQVLDFVPSVIKDFVKNLFFKNHQFSSAVLLKNGDDMFYAGDIFVGSDKQNLTVIFDTGSDYLVLEDTSCAYCYGRRYNSATSTTYQLFNSTLIS